MLFQDYLVCHLLSLLIQHFFRKDNFLFSFNQQLKLFTLDLWTLLFLKKVIKKVINNNSDNITRLTVGFFYIYITLQNCS